MIPISIKLAKKPPSAESIAKNMRFGIAVGLTETAKQGQAAVQDALRSTFTLRGGWFEQSNKFGIKIKPAKKDDLSAEVRTNADWLEKQREGGNIPASKDERIFHYTYKGRRYIAEPSRALRPRGSKKIIVKRLWPSTLRRKKSTFVIVTRRSKTPVVMTRFAPGKDGYEAMYILRPDIMIQKQDTFSAPIEKAVKRRLDDNIQRGLIKAFSTMK